MVGSVGKMHHPNYFFNAQRTLQAGFTTIRDVGAMEGVDLQLKQLLDRGPRLLVSGEPILRPEGALQQVQDRVNEGVDVIKIFNDGQFKQEQIRQIVNSTRLPVSHRKLFLLT